MHAYRIAKCLLVVVALAIRPDLAAAQHEGHDMGAMAAGPAHEMWSTPLGGGWTLAGAAQVFPVLTFGASSGDRGLPLRQTEWYLTQPAVMGNLESPDQRLVLRTTLNFEGVTLPDGELTFGGWGEGYIDKRHPHTLLHELMLSLNAWTAGGGALSLSAGKGFAPYGTDDPMARPVLKYPTNHHLSQILERWTVNALWAARGWSLEAGLFGGAEPTGPYDLSNIESFGDSWSARLIRRWGAGGAAMPEWEASVSYGSVTEGDGAAAGTTRLWNAALRYDGQLGGGGLYALLEGSRSDPERHAGYFSVLGEARYEHSGHQPYVRLEYATRPEHHRLAGPGEDGFFRYGSDHPEPMGATRWLITTVAYAREVSGYPWSARPFVEVQHHLVRGERGGFTARQIFGVDSFFALSLGVRLYMGGGPMRMGRYGVLDSMSTMRRAMPGMMQEGS